MSALCDKKEQAAINLRQEKKLEDAKVAASEIESKLRKEIEALQKYVPSVSKPVSKTVETGKPWYAGYGKEQVVHLVKDDNALKLNKTIEKFKRGNNLKSYGAEVRLKSHRNIQLIDPLNLTARQINQNLLKDGKDSCKKHKCMEEVAAIDWTTSYIYESSCSERGNNAWFVERC